MKSEVLHKTGKYLLCILVVFFVLKYMSSEKMSTQSIMLISIITALIFAIIDNSTLLFENNNEKTQCATICANREHMTSGNSIISAIATNTESNNITSDLSKITDALTKSEEFQKNIKSKLPEILKNLSKSPELATLKKYTSTDLTSDYDKFQKRFEEIVEDRTQHNPAYKTDSEWISRNDDASYTVHYQRRSPEIVANGSRSEDGVAKDDTKYNVISYNTVPPNVNQGSFEYGYSFLPPTNWYPTPPFPPVCVADTKAKVYPSPTDGTNAELKTWDDNRRIMPPDEINVDYVTNVLNSGR